LDPGAQEAEFVAFWVGQNVPALGAGLADVDRPGAESEQPLQLGVLVAVGGVDVDVQWELPGPRVAAGAEDASSGLTSSNRAPSLLDGTLRNSGTISPVSGSS
jgi:hypothetical protein